MNKILLTGCAGFIGMHVAEILLKRGDVVIGVDNLNGYYDVNLKLDRLKHLNEYANFEFIKYDIADLNKVEQSFLKYKPNLVINLAAQAGVRYSIENPSAYIQSNIVGFCNLLEACRHNNVEHFVYASSSSVYGSNTSMPFSVHDNVDHPLSVYAATKKSNELLAHVYSHLFKLPTTGLRFFTVYGPWGRPDMSPWLFTSAINEGRYINVFNNGEMKRDFTYIDDVAEGTVKVLGRIPTCDASFSTEKPDPGRSNAPYKVYNIGNNNPVELMTFIEAIEKALGKVALKNYLPMQSGDVIATYADIEDLKVDINFQPKTQLVDGISGWCDWYKNYKKYR